MAQGNARSSGYEKAEHSWYVEPASTVEALLDHESFDGPVWDPAAGGGNIPDICNQRGLHAAGTDIVDRGAGLPIIDFMSNMGNPWFTLKWPNIITNPPFDLIEPFIHKALQIATRKVAILGRLALLEGKNRRDTLWTTTCFARVWVCSSRISMPPGGQGIEPKGGSIAFAWFVFSHDHPIGKPAEIGFLP